MQELVYQRQRTTYKDVANELIDQLKKNSEMQELAGLNEVSSDEDEDDDVSVEESAAKRSRACASDKKS